METLIYARFSSLLQNPRSIEDQVSICRERCHREGWEIVGLHTDHAISGAAGITESQRPGLAAMLARIEAGGIDQVLAESTDRIARHEGDSFAIRERLAFANVRLFTLSDGEITQMVGTIKGMTDANFRKELGAKIKRGQRGTVAQGRSPAGLAYGYRMANRIDTNGRAVRGLREVDPDQATVVRRIFQDYADGISPKRIAELLNAEGILDPRGDRWRATTLRPDRTRGNGLLQNQLYVGRIVHNRTSKVVEPMTRASASGPIRLTSGRSRRCRTCASSIRNSGIRFKTDCAVARVAHLSSIAVPATCCPGSASAVFAAGRGTSGPLPTGVVAAAWRAAAARTTGRSRQIATSAGSLQGCASGCLIPNWSRSSSPNIRPSTPNGPAKCAGSAARSSVESLKPMPVSR